MYVRSLRDQQTRRDRLIFKWRNLFILVKISCRRECTNVFLIGNFSKSTVCLSYSCLSETHWHLGCARSRLSIVSSRRFSPRDDTNWMIQYRGNVIGNEIGRPSRFVTCNFSTWIPRAAITRGRKSRLHSTNSGSVFVSSTNKIIYIPESHCFFFHEATFTVLSTAPACRLIISMNEYEFST